MFCRTHAFDDCRFFVPPSSGGRESGERGWVRITVKGRRETLSGIDPERSALVIVDMQQGCVHGWDVDYARYADDPSEPQELRSQARELGRLFAERMAQTVVPNIGRLLGLFHQQGLPVVYLRLRDDVIIPELAPASGDIVLTKYSGGAFATSALDNALREHGIATLFITGTDTAGCVEATINEACDRSYQTILVEDACCSSRPDLHEAVVRIWRCRGFVRSTAQVIKDYPWQSWVDPRVNDG